MSALAGKLGKLKQFRINYSFACSGDIGYWRRGIDKWYIILLRVSAINLIEYIKNWWGQGDGICNEVTWTPWSQ
jgi:hypothetical protein